MSLTGKDLWSKYSKDPKKDGFNNPIPNNSLLATLSMQPDFENEVTLLQHYSEKRSIDGGCHIALIRSPKCHPELAGEGIEYDWGAAKKWYRRQPLVSKRSKKKFTETVKESLQKVTLDYRRSFSKRAREYMIAYQTVELYENGEVETGNEEFKSSAHIIDKVVGCRKSHRSVSQDTGWLNKLLSTSKSSKLHDNVD